MSHQFTKGGQTAWFHEDWIREGHYHTYDCLSLEQHKPHKIHIFLPREYESSGEKYPCIYMNDGNTAFWNGGLGNKSWKVAETLATLYRESKVKKVIVVAVCPVDREAEYTHDHWMFFRPSGGLKQYSLYLTKVKEFIDSNYRTLSDRQSTAIMGSSHGGLAAFYTACSHPDKFGFCGSMSPSFWAGLDFVGLGRDLASSSLLKETSLSLTDVNKRPTLWIDWGLRRDGGVHNFIVEAFATSRSKEMVELLKSKYKYQVEKDLFTFEDKIGGHDEDAWCYRFKLFMETFFPHK